MKKKTIMAIVYTCIGTAIGYIIKKYKSDKIRMKLSTEISLCNDQIDDLRHEKSDLKLKSNHDKTLIAALQATLSDKTEQCNIYESELQKYQMIQNTMKDMINDENGGVASIALMIHHVLCFEDIDACKKIHSINR